MKDCTTPLSVVATRRSVVTILYRGLKPTATFVTSLRDETANLRKALPLVAVLLLPISLAGTGCQTVEPWERGALADYTMQADRDPIGDAQSDHIFFSREEASGGKGVGGGGCGCN